MIRDDSSAPRVVGIHALADRWEALIPTADVPFLERCTVLGQLEWAVRLPPEILVPGRLPDKRQDFRAELRQDCEPDVVGFDDQGL